MHKNLIYDYDYSSPCSLSSDFGTNTELNLVSKSYLFFALYPPSFSHCSYLSKFIGQFYSWFSCHFFIINSSEHLSIRNQVHCLDQLVFLTVLAKFSIHIWFACFWSFRSSSNATILVCQLNPVDHPCLIRCQTRIFYFTSFVGLWGLLLSMFSEFLFFIMHHRFHKYIINFRITLPNFRSTRA